VTALVLLPGLDGTGILFQPLLQQLPATWRSVVVSYPMDAVADYEVLTGLAGQAVPATGPVVLLGESFSGPIAIKLAAVLGARVEALILCCSFVRNPRPSLSRLGGLVDLLPSPARLPPMISACALLGAGGSAEVRSLLAQALVRLPATVLRARLRMVMRVNVTRELAAVRAPVVYLQAAQDWVVPSGAAVEVRKAQPRTVVLQLPGPHGLLQAEPQRSVTAMTSFLRGLD
jgi:pimeloyl-[acyl-carrier protein] methyl ester esterase